MNTFKLSNITLAQLRIFLKYYGFEEVKDTKGRGGHEKWEKAGLLRPVIFSSHIDPVPELYIQNLYRNIGINKKKFIEEFQKANKK
jgi:hypothetical protein